MLTKSAQRHNRKLETQPAKLALGKAVFGKPVADQTNDELAASIYYSRHMIAVPKGHRAQKMAVIAELKRRGLPV